MITVTIENVNFPNSQCINITFPIDEKIMMNKLKDININNYITNHCRVVEIKGMIPALSVLENSLIDVDEMNYLARRIESFDKYERAKFQGVVAAENICKMKDLINLTFNLNNYTIVTDFSDLYSIGTNHYLDKNVCYAVDEKDKIDFETIGRNLLNRGNGKITPYGVLFSSQLPFEEVYDGRMFPDYDYTSDYVMKLEITQKHSLGFEPPKVWLYLPTSETCILKTLLRLGADNYNDLDYKCVNSISLSENFMGRISLTNSIGEINKLSEIIKELDQSEIKKLEAAIDYTGAESAGKMVELANNLDQFHFVAGISDLEQYGKHIVAESGLFSSNSELEKYLNFTKYGQDRFNQENGCFTSFGYICRIDSMEACELDEKSKPYERQEENEQKMGGM